MDPGPSLPGPGVPQDPPRRGGDGGGGPCTTCVPPDSVVACNLDMQDFPDVAPILNDPAFAEALASLWKNSKPNAANDERQEQGGWIVYRDGHYSIVPFEQVQEDIHYTSCSVRGPTVGHMPRGTVAIIHTHPADRGAAVKDAACLIAADHDPTKDIGKYKYHSWPSTNDYFAASDVARPAFLVSSTKIHWFTTSRDTVSRNRKPLSFARCGY